MLKKNIPFPVILILIQIVFLLPVNAQKTARLKSPKNVIIMIGDGMGFNHIKAADYYQYGEEGKQVYEKFPVKYAVATFPGKTGSYGKEQSWGSSYSPYDAWKTFEYLKNNYTESAGAATALATGKKTYNNSIGMDLEYREIENVLEAAHKIGKTTGVVTSVPFFDATPAAFVAHSVTRKYAGKIIEEMIIDSKCSVIMGTGNPYFDNDGKKVDDKSANFSDAKELWEQLFKGSSVEFTINGKQRKVSDIDYDGTPDSWTFIQEKDDFVKLKKGETPKMVLGIPQVISSLQSSRSGDINALPYAVPLNKNVPSLDDMAMAAINVLSKNKNGFAVMIEGGAIDKAGHANSKGRLIEEMIDFNKTVEAVVDWVETNSSWDETLLVITADHETGYLWGPEKGKFNELVNNGKGEIPGMEFNTGGHSNSLVAMFAKGCGSQLFHLFADQTDSVRGKYMNNTVIPGVIKTLFLLN